MTELIHNTLQIISKISRSKCGYLLRVNNAGFEILSIWGESADKFDVFNKSLLDQYKTGEIKIDSPVISSAFDQLAEKLSLGYYLIQEVLQLSERNESIYILIFSAMGNPLSGECKDNIVSILSLLSSQLKKWIEDTNLTITTSSEADESTAELSDEDLIASKEKNFNELLEISGELIFVLNKSGSVVLVNNSGAQSLDYTGDEIKGKHIIDFAEAENARSISDAIKNVLRKNRVIKFEAILRSKYERNIPYEISCKSITKNGKVIGLMGIGKDISRQRNTEIEISKIKPMLVETNRLLKVERSRTRHHLSLIEELNRLKSDFVSNISHEFRTPLASIIGFSETIESDPDLPAEMKKEFNNVILKEGKRLAKLINDILDISSIESGKAKPNKTEFDVILTIIEVVNANRSFANEKKIDLIFENTEEEILLEADEDLLKQAFNALLDNSIKFTNEYGRVKIIASSNFREFELIVSDTGVGIPEKDLPYIFQKFYRGTRSGFETVGTGVGLVFVKQIADLHKGLITVQSESGGGSTFVLKLPKISKIETSEVNSE